VTDLAGDAVADPAGVMAALIADADPGLSPGTIREAVNAVAGGRAKQRRLALALAGRPGILSDGRSPAPRALGDLLIELVRAGAAEISPSACAQCCKALRTLQRRGEDWYCSVCSEVREPCAACGQARRVSSRDRAGPGAGNARTATGATRSTSFTASSPPLTPPPGGKPSPMPSAAPLPGPHTSRDWHGCSKRTRPS
jgi:hypothetical protein